jgi:2-keto-4-pentenoate hydratase/2-oxohepta-3-ene-1,7-dioic acid hydratase in catechol pathway
MRFIRFGDPRKERPGILTASGVRKDLSTHFADWDSDFWGGDGPQRVHELLKSEEDSLPSVPENARWGAPIARPHKIICIGLNYSDHAAETGAAIPTEPILFMKASNTVIGPFDDIEIPRGSTKTDWEVELGVIIGRPARYLRDAAQAREHIAGYVLSHDVSERAFQLERGGQWTKGKSCDTFNPLGPFLLSADALSNPGNLAMQLRVNGERRQAGNTSTMVFDVFTLVHYISQFMTLESGDLISTGTPPGVGLGMKPPQYLKAGDIIELEIEQLGSQRQRCIPARP